MKLLKKIILSGFTLAIIGGFGLQAGDGTAPFNLMDGGPAASASVPVIEGTDLFVPESFMFKKGDSWDDVDVANANDTVKLRKQLIADSVNQILNQPGITFSSNLSKEDIISATNNAIEAYARWAETYKLDITDIGLESAASIADDVLRSLRPTYLVEKGLAAEEPLLAEEEPLEAVAAPLMQPEGVKISIPKIEAADVSFPESVLADMSEGEIAAKKEKLANKVNEMLPKYIGRFKISPLKQDIVSAVDTKINDFVVRDRMTDIDEIIANVATYVPIFLLENQNKSSSAQLTTKSALAPVPAEYQKSLDDEVRRFQQGRASAAPVPAPAVAPVPAPEAVPAGESVPEKIGNMSYDDMFGERSLGGTPALMLDPALEDPVINFSPEQQSRLDQLNSGVNHAELERLGREQALMLDPTLEEKETLVFPKITANDVIKVVKDDVGDNVSSNTLLTIASMIARDVNKEFAENTAELVGENLTKDNVLGALLQKIRLYAYYKDTKLDRFTTVDCKKIAKNVVNYFKLTVIPDLEEDLEEDLAADLEEDLASDNPFDMFPAVTPAVASTPEGFDPLLDDLWISQEEAERSHEGFGGVTTTDKGYFGFDEPVILPPSVPSEDPENRRIISKKQSIKDRLLTSKRGQYKPKAGSNNSGKKQSDLAGRLDFFDTRKASPFSYDNPLFKQSAYKAATTNGDDGSMQTISGEQAATFEQAATLENSFDENKYRTTGHVDFVGNSENLVDVEAALIDGNEYSDIINWNLPFKQKALTEKIVEAQGDDASISSTSDSSTHIDSDNDSDAGGAASYEDDLLGVTPSSSPEVLPEASPDAAPVDLSGVNLVDLEAELLKNGLNEHMTNIYATTILENNLAAKVKLNKAWDY